MENFREKEKPKICFVSHFAYGVMTGGGKRYVGGVERQTSLMAKWFASCGYDVSMITWDEGQEDGLLVDGVKIYKLCRQNSGIPVLRFFIPRWASLNAAMKHADADIYYQNCAEEVTGQVSFWCKVHGKKFMYSVASDPDCEYQSANIEKWYERIFYRYGVRNADRIIVQTQKQKNLLADNYDRSSVVLPMPCIGGERSGGNGQFSEGREGVLWIGRICQQKRPDLLLDVARKCPDLKFDLVGPFGNDEYAKDIFAKAKEFFNITIHGAIKPDEVSGFYRKAEVLCCTSDAEGFPNSFLEAWSFGLPVVSTFDPDNLIRDKKLGIVCSNVDELEAGIRLLLRNPQQLSELSKTVRQYYLENHTVDTVMTLFEKEFLSFSA